MKFPTRDNCDPNNPEEAFLWMLVALPGQRGGQLVMPIEYLKQVSKRLWDCGARPVAEPTIEYQPPTGNEPHWLTSPGTWKPAGPPQPVTEVEQVDAALGRMGYQQKAELLSALCAWERGKPIPETPAGRIVKEQLSEHQRRLILKRLREAEA